MPDVEFSEILNIGLKAGGESVLVNGAVFKTVSETVRTGSGRFDSYTPPPKQTAVGRAVGSAEP